MSHRIASPAKRQTKAPAKQPEPGYYCREFRVPIDVLDRIGTPVHADAKKKHNYVFTHTHVTLLGSIDMMVNWRGLGWWASNHHLGEKIHVTEDRVKQLIRDCLKLGLLINEGLREI